VAREERKRQLSAQKPPQQLPVAFNRDGVAIFPLPGLKEPRILALGRTGSIW